MQEKIAVIGGGIIGTAVARELAGKDGREIVLFEKEDAVAFHQTGHNSGVVHAGLYYEPGSLKARLCRRGVDLMKTFCTAQGLAYDEVGKLLIAANGQEHERLQGIYARAQANGVPGVRMLRTDEIQEVEPHAVGYSALYSPTTAIVDYAAITQALAADFESNGGVVRTSTEVLGVQNRDDGVVVRMAGEELLFDRAIVCAGLQSDRLAQKSGGSQSPRIVPFFGQYSLLTQEDAKLVKGLIYPVPDPNYPFLGVHLTRRVDGAVMVGPNAFLSLGREKYSTWGVSRKDFFDVVRTRGFWKFGLKNAATAVDQLKTVLSHRAFMRGAEAFVPALRGATSKPMTKGIRAQAMDRDGQLVEDFVIERIGRVTHIRNAPSPGATASLAIAEHIVKQTLDVNWTVEGGLPLLPTTGN